MDKESWKIKNEKRDCSILKPASSSSNTSPPHLLQKPSQEVPIQRPDSTEIQRPNFIFESSCIQNLEQKCTQAVRSVNRCSSCGKRVRLTGFRCRCGDLFCGRHRYSDVHDCSFDYKAAGREEISKANPVIRTAKIIKI